MALVNVTDGAAHSRPPSAQPLDSRRRTARRPAVRGSRCWRRTVTVLNNPTHFSNPFHFEITFECLEPLNDGAPPPSLASMPGPGGRPALPHSHPDALGADLEWKLIYVGSAYDQQKDQVGSAPAPRLPRGSS